MTSADTALARHYLADLAAGVRARGIRKTARDAGWTLTTLHRRVTDPGTLSFLEAWNLANTLGPPYRLRPLPRPAAPTLQSPAELPFASPI